MKHARKLATDVTSNGAVIFDLLNKEVDFKVINDYDEFCKKFKLIENVDVGN